METSILRNYLHKLLSVNLSTGQLVMFCCAHETLLIINTRKARAHTHTHNTIFQRQTEHKHSIPYS